MVQSHVLYIKVSDQSNCFWSWYALGLSDYKKCIDTIGKSEGNCLCVYFSFFKSAHDCGSKKKKSAHDLSRKYCITKPQDLIIWIWFNTIPWYVSLPCDRSNDYKSTTNTRIEMTRKNITLYRIRVIDLTLYAQSSPICSHKLCIERKFKAPCHSLISFWKIVRIVPD